MQVIGRFAPSPSGPLHLGSLVAALASYCQAKSQQGLWLLRIEDVDTPRVLPGSADQILRALESFGFEWDGAVLYQSEQFEHYRHYLENLLERGLVYACACSRKTWRARGVDSGPLGQIYPGICRDKQLRGDRNSIRLNTLAAGQIVFHDRVYGEIALDLPRQVGDFLLRRADGIYAYHLAVVVDDYLQQVNEIVRGADLLENTCLHIFLQQCLGLPTPGYLHVPLVNNTEGIKLSKQTCASGLNPQNSSKLLVAALRHLGQMPAKELEKASPAAILEWAVRHWRHQSISPTLAASSEVFVE